MEIDVSSCKLRGVGETWTAEQAMQGFLDCLESRSDNFTSNSLPDSLASTFEAINKCQTRVG